MFRFKQVSKILPQFFCSFICSNVNESQTWVLVFLRNWILIFC